jgi:hypothetical protein
MTNEQVIRWMVEHGTDWVDADRLYTTWASKDIRWDEATKEGYLIYHGAKGALRLTDYAINKMKERDDGLSK